MTERIMTDANGRKYITTEPFKPDWDAMAVMVEEQQRMAKRILELEALLERQTAWLERQTARIVDLQTHIDNFESEQNALAGIAKLIWPFPTELPPAKPSKPIRFSPENYEDAPW